MPNVAAVTRRCSAAGPTRSRQPVPALPGSAPPGPAVSGPAVSGPAVSGPRRSRSGPAARCCGRRRGSRPGGPGCPSHRHGHGRRLCRRGQRQPAADRQQGHRDHAVRIGAQPAEEPEVLHQYPVGQAEQDEHGQRGPDHLTPPGQEGRADRGQRDHRDQVDREAVTADDRFESGYQVVQEPRLRGLRHRLDHAGQRAGLAVLAALPETPTRPGLQHGHSQQEQPEAGQHGAAQPRRPPAPIRQGQQPAGDDVDQRRAGGAEQPGQPGSEDPAERLTEDPDDQPPGHAGQPGQPARDAAWRGEQPQPDAYLYPHRCGAGLDRVVGPGGAGPIDQVLDPDRGTGRGRLDDLGRQARGHTRLGLQQPVEQP